jgi:hypothetical protein
LRLNYFHNWAKNSFCFYFLAKKLNFTKIAIIMKQQKQKQQQKQFHFVQFENDIRNSTNSSAGPSAYQQQLDTCRGTAKMQPTTTTMMQAYAGGREEGEHVEYVQGGMIMGEQNQRQQQVRGREGNSI